MFAAYDKYMKCIISVRFVLESRSKVLNGVYVLLHMINTWNVLYHSDLFSMENFMHRDEISKMYDM